MNEWRPLEDQYSKYLRHVEEAKIEGLLASEEDVRAHGYPEELHLAESEQDELGKFVFERTQELFASHVNPHATAQQLLNVIISGMLWERERIGN